MTRNGVAAAVVAILLAVVLWVGLDALLRGVEAMEANASGLEDVVRE